MCEPTPTRPSMRCTNSCDGHNVLGTKVALFPAGNPEAQLNLVAYLLKPSPLVRAPFVLALLLGQLLPLRPGQLLPALLWAISASTRSRSTIHVASTPLRRIIVRHITGLNREKEPARMFQLSRETDMILRWVASYSGLIAAVPGGSCEVAMFPAFPLLDEM